MTAPPDRLRRHLLAGGMMLACNPLLARPSGSPGAEAAPRLLLATAASPEVDPRGYLVSEKYDGVRACWDGRSLRFRSGRTVFAPDWFLRRLPAQPLDGELWLGRRRFDELSAIVRTQRAADAGWQALSYLIFELPGAAGSFEQRAAQIESLVSTVGWPTLQAVAQTRVADRGDLRSRLDQVVRSGGEGLMLHRADASYLTGRSDALLKLKPQADEEAVVIGLRAGRGRHAGRMGALQVRTDDDRVFWLGSGFSDAERADPPPPGSRLLFRYRELTPSGLPRFASFVRRADTF